MTSRKLDAAARLDLVLRAGRRIGTTLDVFHTAQELVDIVVPELAEVAGVEILDSVMHGDAPAPGPLIEPISVRRAAFRRYDAEEPGYTIGEIRVMRPDTPHTKALGDLRPRLVNRISENDTWLVRDPVRANMLRGMGAHSLMALPMVARGVVLGVAALYRTGDSPAFDEDDLELAVDLVTHTALCVDNARRFTREHTLGRLLQRRIAPARLPGHTAVETAKSYLSVASSGTWCDVIPLSGFRVGLVVGQVVGQGLSAVTAMGQLRTAVTALAGMDLPPEELLTKLHELTVGLIEEREHRVTPRESPWEATCLYGTYDPVSRTFEVATCGHPDPDRVMDAPLLVALPPGGPAHRLGIRGGPLLGRGLPDYPQTVVELAEGTVLAVCSAGFTAEGLPGRIQSALEDCGGRLQDTGDRLTCEVSKEKKGQDALVLLARTRAFGPDRAVSWALPDTTASTPAARRLVTEQLTAWELDELSFTTELIASELVTNAVRHSTGDIELRLIRDRALVCEVSDSASTSPHLRHAETNDEGGRGLYVVSEITQRWGTRPTERGKTIWAEQPLP